MSPSCAQPSEKEIFDFVFEHGKGNAIYHACAIYNPTNNADYIKFRTQNPNTISTPIFAIQHSQNIPRQFSLLAAIHLFISSCDEIKISARWIKKLVAVTGGVYASIHFYNLAIASVTAGTVCPAAYFCVRGICIITNNAAFIKYRTKKSALSLL